MLVDDSAVIRGAIARLLQADPDIQVVARAADGRAAVAVLAQHDIDLVLLDIEMPVLDGLSALPLLLQARPGLRVIMASTLTTRGAESTLRALRLGAADCIAKPAAMGGADQAFAAELIAKIKAIAGPRRRAASAAATSPAATSPAATSPAATSSAATSPAAAAASSAAAGS